MTENWLDTDEVDDVAGSLREAVRSVRAAQTDPQAWKWVALALHSALQGACICHLTTSATPIGVVTKSNEREWLAYFEQSRIDRRLKQPKTCLMNLPDLLKEIRKPYSAGDRRNTEGINLDDAELAWLDRFHKKVRNQFIHFAPMGWSIELSGIPRISILVTRIIEDILLIGYGFRHQELSKQKDMQDALKILASLNWPIQP